MFKPKNGSTAKKTQTLEPVHAKAEKTASCVSPKLTVLQKMKQTPTPTHAEARNDNNMPDPRNTSTAVNDKHLNLPADAAN